MVHNKCLTNFKYQNYHYFIIIYCNNKVRRGAGGGGWRHSLLEANKNRKAPGVWTKNSLLGVSILGDRISSQGPQRHRRSALDKNTCLFKGNLNNQNFGNISNRASCKIKNFSFHFVFSGKDPFCSVTVTKWSVYDPKGIFLK